jgi:hypothetical protein
VRGQEGVEVYLGTYSSKEEAQQAEDEYREAHHDALTTNREIRIANRVHRSQHTRRRDD